MNNHPIILLESHGKTFLFRQHLGRFFTFLFRQLSRAILFCDVPDFIGELRCFTILLSINIQSKQVDHRWFSEDPNRGYKNDGFMPHINFTLDC